MAILLTNDDGIDAPGLAALVDALQGLDRLYVAAPASNQSGVGMGITIDRGLTPVRHPDGPGGAERYALDGTPADAVKFGVGHLFNGERPRLVVSGINHGPNIGRNVHCSGTVGAALEAVAYGIPALAVSVDYALPPNWEGAKHYARKVAEKLLAMTEQDFNGEDAFVFNLNVPSAPPEEIPGLVFARHGLGGFRDTLDPEPETGAYVLGGGWLDFPDGGDCDGAAFASGYAVATPLRFEMTHPRLLEHLRENWNDNDKAGYFRGGRRKQ